MGCSGCLKVMMILFNGIIFLAGVAVLGIGIWVKVDGESLLKVLGNIENAPPELNHIFNVGYVLIVVGAILMVIGFLGCCGAMKESRCMLLTFFVIVLVVFLAEVGAAIVVFVLQGLAEKVVNKLGDEAVKSIKKDYGNNIDLTGLWNTTMDGLKCCGFYNYTDFTGSPFQSLTANYPDYCCTSSPCSGEKAQEASVPGCFHKMITLIEDNAAIIGGVAIGIALIEIAAMVVSITLFTNIGKSR